MFRAIGDAIWYVITTPARLFRWCCDCVGRLRRFLDQRRNHLCAAVIAVMMAVVGIQLRHSGYADLRPGEYVSVEENTSTEKPKPSKKSLRTAIRDSLASIKAKLPSLRGTDEPKPDRKTETVSAEPRKVPVVTASQHRSIAPSASALTIPNMVAPASSEKTLILPEPKIIDLSELEDVEEPHVAQLRGLIETDDDEDNSIFGDDE